MAIDKFKFTCYNLPESKITLGKNRSIQIKFYSKSRKPRIYPWMNAFSAEGGQLNSFCCEAVLEDTTALSPMERCVAVELHRRILNAY